MPKHLKAVARFSLETGLRNANVTGLEWAQVELARRCAWIHPDQAKARRAIPVPLSQAAVETPPWDPTTPAPDPGYRFNQTLT